MAKEPDPLEQLENPDEALRKSKFDNIIEFLRAIAEVDKTEMFDENGEYKPPGQWPEKFKLAVKSVNRDHRTEKVAYIVTFHDPIAAAKLLVQYESLQTEEKAEITPFDAIFERLPRRDLLELKERLDQMAKLRAEQATARAAKALETN